MIKFLQYLLVACVGILLPMLLPFSPLYAPLTSYISSTSGVSAQEELVQGIKLSPFLLNSIYKKIHGSHNEFYSSLRRVIISQLINEGFSGFATKYPGYTLHLGTGSSFFASGETHQDLDQLDFWLHKNILTKNEGPGFVFDKGLVLERSLYQERKGIYMFKSIEDLKQLGYQVISWRTRINKDASYRRHNIASAFSHFGNIRIVNPGQVLSFYKNIGYDPTFKKNYKEGLIIKADEEIPEYGGGICGASTAIYQGMVTNKSIERLQVRNHSKWYHNLYTAVINGEKITTPGVDSTVYDGYPDLVVKNINTHPIILISNYDGLFGGVEENFTLGFRQDKGSLKYVSSEPQKMIVEGKTKLGKCYTWNINGVEKKSCYNELK